MAEGLSAPRPPTGFGSQEEKADRALCELSLVELYGLRIDGHALRPRLFSCRISRHGYLSQMKTANVATTRNELSRLLRRVKCGETVIITERNRPVARLLPFDSTAAPASADLDALFASGALLPPAGGPLDIATFLAAPRASLPAKASLSAAVPAEREEGR